MNIRSLFSLLILISFASALSAQTKAERIEITSQSNGLQLEKAFQEIESISEQRKSRALNYSLSNNIPLKSYDQDGNLILLQDVDIMGNPIYIAPYNFTGVLTIGADHLYPGGGLNIEITGAGIDAGIWDGGYTRQTHQDLVGRVTYGEGDSAVSGHGTHVGGTMIGDGTGVRSRRGVAYGGSLTSYEFDNDSSEMFREAADGMLVSNHSYGRLLEGNVDVILGKYDSTARTFDIITSQNEYYLPVVSAGNDRNDGFNIKDNGYDLLTDRALAKNVLTVGAVNSVLNYTDASSVEMSSFSSWGPTDDGRIKPDLVAKGVAVNSTEGSSDTAYGNRQGTSMSSPMVSGGIMLLQELYNNLNSTFMKSASVRALVLSTTKEAGRFDGPDYSFGWGLMDVEKAAEVLLNENASTLLDERNLISGESYTKNIIANGNSLKVALAWTDPQGDVNSSDEEDDSTPSLVNDFDIKLTDANGVDYFPWKLDPTRFTSAATKGVNDVDNIEVVDIESPSGEYMITIDHKGELKGGSSNYTLLINGVDVGTLSNRTEILDTIKLYPNPASTHFNVALSNQLTGSKIQINIYDTMGKLVSQKKFDNTGSFDNRIDTSSLKSGIYLVQITDGSASTTKKLVIR